MDGPDSRLVEASRDGDEAAYAELVHRHLKRIFAICLGHLGRVVEAEDATQESFVRAHQKIRTLDDAERFSAWVAQIARNHCRDLLRARSRRPEEPLSPMLLDMSSSLDDEFSDLRQALERLPEEHRTPLLLYYYDGKDTNSLARELQLSQGGACARLYRARKHLRQLLEEVNSDAGRVS